MDEIKKEEQAIEDEISYIEDCDHDLYEYEFNSADIKLCDAYINLLRKAIKLRKEFFCFTYQDHDDSIELKIEENEFIVLFRQEGIVINAKSFYLFSYDYDESDIEDFLSIFKA
jgi:hypothetical protein